MTGTGTQADPYIVDNWADFLTIDTNSTEIHVRWADAENKIIDFNDIHPEGFSETVNFPAYVDFNGWTLKNFHSTSNYYSFRCSSGTIENLTLENFYITSSSLFYGVCMLKNCIFSGLMQSTSSIYAFNGCGLVRCAVNIVINSTSNVSLVTGSGFGLSATKIENSDIVLEINNANSIVICSNAMTNSRISGKIQSESQKVMLGNSSSMSNVFSIETNVPLYYQGNGISVYNSDFAEKSSDSNKNFLGVTSEQLKSAEYLHSIGFPIGIE